MSTFVLKIIAIITMLIDHIGAVFLANGRHPELYFLFRAIGRIAFPIFVFLIVEGFHHTRDVKKYLKRLGAFALISEIPFDLAFYKGDFSDIALIFENNGFDWYLAEDFLKPLFEHQNVYFTLFLGLFAIYLMSLVEKRYVKRVIISNLLDAIITIGFCMIAFFLKTDYDITGILLIVAFYLFRGSKAMLTISIIILMGGGSDINKFQATGNLIYIVTIFAVLAMIPIALYNGKKGKDVKYIFYIFYPAHLLLLFVIKQFL